MEPANWNCLPSEIKCMIIRFMDRVTRTSLKQCSHLDKELVDLFPLKTLHGCRIVGEIGWFTLYIHNSKPLRYNSQNDYTKTEFDSVEELDKYFQYEVFNKYEKIEKCFLCLISGFEDQQSYFNTFQFSHSNYKIKIFDLVIRKLKIGEMMMLLKRVDETFLERLEIRASGFDSELYDMPQVINAKHLVVYSNSITGKQLLKLKASHLKLYQSRCLTAKDLNKYLKKRLSEVSEETWMFHISFINEESAEKIVCDGLVVEETGRIRNRIPVKLIQSEFFQFEFEIYVHNDWVTVQKIEFDQDFFLK